MEVVIKGIGTGVGGDHGLEPGRFYMTVGTTVLTLLSFCTGNISESWMCLNRPSGTDHHLGGLGLVPHLLCGLARKTSIK